ncbi:MAG: SpoIIE family protein phosphatase [Actinobacteria bacterium]|nr:SpoIIE family protein phosphatase [Actinomycetota bacterium]
MQDPGGAEPLPDARVLGWLLATQNVLQALPEQRLAEFVTAALADVPGVGHAELRIPGEDDRRAEPDGGLGGQGGVGGPIDSGGHDVADRDGPVSLPLATSRGEYGEVVLTLSDPALFAVYEPFVANFAGSLGLLLENRDQRSRLEKALDELVESEKRYRLLFTEMTSGHAVHEIILDEDGSPCDYRFLEVNPAFAKLTGLNRDDVLGKRVRELLPGLEPFWVERYGQVAITGEPVRFEEYNRDLDRHYEVIAYRPQEGQFAVVFSDITERRQMEQQLRDASDELAAMNEELAAQNAELADQQEELAAEQEETARLLGQQQALFAQLQEALLDIPRALPGVEFGHLYHSATENAKVGGDFYDVFEAKNGKIGLLIGDVSGHGIPAARLATLVKDTVRAFAHQFGRPHLVLREANRLLVTKGRNGFVTAFLGFLDVETGELTYSSAGHMPPLLACPVVGALEAPGGLPLGVFAEARYRDHKVIIPAESLLLLYTDGLTEARRGSAFFGERRLMAFVREMCQERTDSIPAHLLTYAMAFAGGVLNDDIALLAVRYRGGVA